MPIKKVTLEDLPSPGFCGAQCMPIFAPTEEACYTEASLGFGGTRETWCYPGKQKGECWGSSAMDFDEKTIKGNKMIVSFASGELVEWSGRAGSEGKQTCCSRRGSQGQFPASTLGLSQLPINSISGDLTPSSGLCIYSHILIKIHLNKCLNIINTSQSQQPMSY